MTVSHEETGIMVSSYNYEMEKAEELEIEIYDESNWPYTVEGAWTTNIALTSSKYSAYKISIKDAEGNIFDTERAFQIQVPIPEKFDLSNLNVRLAQKSGASYKPSYEIDEENRMLTVTISNSLSKYSNSMTVFFYDSIETIDTATLSDGVYQVNVNLVKHSDSAATSMADGTLEDTAILVKDGSDTIIYLSFAPVEIFESPSYTGGLWCEVGEKADGKIDEDSMTVLSYYCNEDGTLKDNEIYDAITELACIKQIFLIKEAISGLEENSELKEARENLKTAIDNAKEVELGEKTVSAFNELTSAINSAQAVYERSNVTVEELNEQI